MEYGLIGEKLGHSYSVEIHRALADYPYELRELSPNQVDCFVQNEPYRGINVTIPYKQIVMRTLNQISPEARAIGAVNTIVNRKGMLIGYNTDFTGMIALLEKAGITVKNRKTLILGTGGTSKTALAVCRHLGADPIVVVSRRAGAGVVDYATARREHADARVIINTTPVGMYPEPYACPVDPADFPLLEGVADAVYHPLQTQLVLRARKRGIPAIGGLYMLAAQGACASALFRDIPFSPQDIETAYRTVLKQKQSPVLIGMPSCGKTTVGKLLAQKLDRPFADADEVLVRRLGCSIASFVAQKGEEAFRQAESEVIRSLAMEGGPVIATGGGAVLRPKNVEALRQNGRLIFLDRDPQLLTPTADRPFSSNGEALQALYHARLPLYREAADITVNANGTPEQVTDDILREWNV